jgi:hypothetical protein
MPIDLDLCIFCQTRGRILSWPLENGDVLCACSACWVSYVVIVDAISALP